MYAYTVCRGLDGGYFVTQAETRPGYNQQPYVIADCGYSTNAETRAKAIVAALDAQQSA